MEKIEFSDIYKFLCSVGIVIILLGFALPYFYFNSQFDLLVTSETLSALTTTARTVIEQRQQIVYKGLQIVPYISATLFVIGSLILSYGLCHWKKKQTGLDIQDELKVKRASKEIQEMTFEEKSEKVEREALEMESTATSTTTSTTTIPAPKIGAIVTSEYKVNYLLIEQELYGKFVIAYSNSHHVLPNVKIGQFQYDIILQAMDRMLKDYIVEIKYAVSVSPAYLKDIIDKMISRSDTYSVNTNKVGTPIIIFVSHRNDIEAAINYHLEKLQGHIPKRVYSKWKIVSIQYDELQNFDLRNALRIL